MACMSSAPLAFVTVLERGDLEHKVLLLLESVRRFGGPFRNAPFWIVQPRPGRLVRSRTLKALCANDAIFVRADLNRAWIEYDFANKPYAAAFVESLLSGRVGTLVYLDSDMLLLGPLDGLVLNGREVAALRPVDKANVGSLSDEPTTPFWRFLYAVCGVSEEDVWHVTSCVDRQSVRAYYSAGLVAVRPEAGIIAKWRDNLERLAAAPGLDEAAASPLERWFLEQASLSATLLAETTRDCVRHLGLRYGYPLHKHKSLPMDRRIAQLEDAVALHYHHEFHARDWRRHVPVGEDVEHWLEERLPLPGWNRRLRRTRWLRTVAAPLYRRWRDARG